MTIAAVTIHAPDGSKASTPVTIARGVSSSPPPPGGYMPLVNGDLPVAPGQLASLPNDAAAAAMVHRSTWEPRPENTQANQTMAPVGALDLGPNVYPAAIWSRVTGRCPLANPTTDELIQWAAAKWGLSDELVRAEMVEESHWYQNHKNAAGIPIFGNGYGDYAPGASALPSTEGSPNCPPASAYNQALGGQLVDPAHPGRVYGPASFGLPQCKWWVWRPLGSTGLGAYPWIETSTATALDVYCAVIRAQYDGLNAWMKGGYTAYKASPGGPLGVLGAVGNWFGGDWSAALPASQWTSTGAQKYVAAVQGFLAARPWAVSGF